MFNWFTKKEPIKKKSLIEIGREKYEASEKLRQELFLKRLNFCNNLLKDIEDLKLDASIDYSIMHEPYVLIKFKNVHLCVYDKYYVSEYNGPNFNYSIPNFYNKESFAERIYFLAQKQNEPILP